MNLSLIVFFTSILSQAVWVQGEIPNGAESDASGRSQAAGVSSSSEESRAADPRSAGGPDGPASVVRPHGIRPTGRQQGAPSAPTTSRNKNN